LYAFLPCTLLAPPMLFSLIMLFQIRHNHWFIYYKCNLKETLL
jgi:hypothetical protein